MDNKELKNTIKEAIYEILKEMWGPSREQSEDLPPFFFPPPPYWRDWRRARMGYEESVNRFDSTVTRLEKFALNFESWAPVCSERQAINSLSGQIGEAVDELKAIRSSLDQIAQRKP